MNSNWLKSIISQELLTKECTTKDSATDWKISTLDCVKSVKKLKFSHNTFISFPSFGGNFNSKSCNFTITSKKCPYNLPRCLTK